MAPTQSSASRTEASSEKTLSTHQPDMGEEQPVEDAGVKKISDESSSCPDGGYGWVVVACCSLINAHSWGLNSSYGVFLAHFVNTNTYPNATVLDYSFIAGLSVGCCMMLAPLATFSVRVLGTRITLVFGSLLVALALISASFTTRIWQLYLSQGVCFGFGMGFLYIASVGLVPQWFDKKRSFANAIAAGGSGLGGLIYNLASEAVIQRYGYQWAYRVIGIASCVVTLICAFLVRDRNKAVGANLEVWNTKMFTRFEFVLLQVWAWLSMFAYLVLVYTLPTYATAIGLTAKQGSIVGAIFNLGQGAGRPFVGLFSDRVGRINIAAFLTFLCGFLCLVWWIFADSYGVLVAFALFAGASAGTYWATVGPVTAEVIGLKDLPVALSMTWLSIILPTIFSEVIALEIRQKDGFLATQLYTGLCYIVAALALVPVRVWKLGQNEKEAAVLERSEAVGIDLKSQTPSMEGIQHSEGAKSSILKRAIAWKRV